MEEIFKILLIDDDEVDRMAVRRALKSANIKVEIVEVTNCKSAIDILQKQAFDCALIDYFLPDGNGLSILEFIRTANIPVSVIILTGQEDELIAVTLMKAGASDYLPKAKLTPDNLSSIMYHAIRIHRAEIETKITTQKLQETEERYRLVLEGSNDAIWDWQISNNKFYWNDKFFDLIGRSRSEFTENLGDFYQLVHPEDQQKIKEALLLHLQKNIDFEVEFRLLHAAGRYRYCICRGKAIRDAQGKPIRVAGIISDITDRQEIEIKLINQQKQAQILAQLTLKISQLLPIAEIFQFTVKELLNFLEVDRTLIYQHLPNSSGKIIAEAILPDWEIIWEKIIIYPSLPEEYIQEYSQGKIQAIPDIDQCNLQSNYLQVLKELDIKANLIVPILLHKPNNNQSQQIEIPPKHISQESQQLQIKSSLVSPSISLDSPFKTCLNSHDYLSLNQWDLWGLIIVHQCSKSRSWRGSEIFFLQQIANQLSIALTLARCYQAV